MRSRAVLCLGFVLALVACSGEGVSIEVRRGSTAAVRVELYVVDGYCTTDTNRELPCPQLKTPSARGYLDGEVYTREDARTLESKVESDGVAYFKILANGSETRIPLAVAVGFDANNTRVGAALMPFEFYTTDNNRRVVTLEPIVEDTVTGTPQQSDGLRAETWYQDPMLGGGCLAIEQTEQGTSKRKFIVPADDLDCDGWLPPDECDEIWPHRAQTDDSPLPFTCVVEEPSGMGKRCMLGDAACIDGEGPAACKPVKMPSQTWCVPSALCDPLCLGSADPQCIYNTLKHPRVPVLKHPTYLHCKVPVQPSTNGAGMMQICRGNIDAQIPAPWTVPATTTCTNFSIGPVTATQIGPFASTLASTSDPANTITTSIGTACTLQIGFAGSFAVAPLDNAVPEHTLKLDLSNSLSLVVPIVVELVPLNEADCLTADAVCTIMFSESDAQLDESLTACSRY